MKKLQLILFWSVYLIAFLNEFTIWWLVALFSIYIWYSWQDEDGIYKMLKDTHQSNLDDIEKQELESYSSIFLKMPVHFWAVFFIFKYIKCSLLLLLSTNLPKSEGISTLLSLNNLAKYRYPFSCLM